MWQSETKYMPRRYYSRTMCHTPTPSIQGYMRYILIGEGM